jgi:cardiolipin synthase
MKRTDNVSVVVTGLGWMRRGVRSIGSVIEDMIIGASDEIQIVIYLVTSGAGDFLQLLKTSLQRGLKLSFIFNSFYSQPVDIQEKFLELAREFTNFVLLDFTGSEHEALHAKIVVVDRKVAFIGSSNLTWGGLTLNYEIGVKIEGPAAKKIADLIDCLARDQRTSQVGHRFV